MRQWRRPREHAGRSAPRCARTPTRSRWTCCRAVTGIPSSTTTSGCRVPPASTPRCGSSTWPSCARSTSAAGSGPPSRGPASRRSRRSWPPCRRAAGRRLQARRGAVSGLAARVADIVRPLGDRYATLSIQHAFALDLAARCPGPSPSSPSADHPQRTRTCGRCESCRRGRAGDGDARPVRRRAGRGGGDVAPVYVFTPNRPAELRVALSVGADAVITDHVAVAVALRARAHAR